METKHPLVIEETAGTKYYCACGLSKNFPYCDGSHKGTEFQPFKVEIPEAKSVAICTCGKSASRPFCDGSHRNS